MDSLGPWEEEQLRRLRIYLQLSGTPIAIVEASSPEFSVKVLSGLYAGLTARTVEVVNLGPSSYRSEMAALWDREPVPGRIVELRGVSGSGTDPSRELLAHLNFNRERFMRPGEAFVFPVDARAATRLLVDAPDLYRFTQRFRFMDWQEVLTAVPSVGAQVAGGLHDAVQHEAALAERVSRLRARGASAARLADALVEHGFALRDLGRWQAARSAFEEAHTAAVGTGDGRVLAAATAGLALCGVSDRAPEEALAIAERAVDQAVQTRDQQIIAMSRTVLAGTLERLHRRREAAEQHLLAARLMPLKAALYLAHASSAYLRAGDLQRAKELAMEALAASSAVELALGTATALEALGDCEFETGHLLDAAEHFRKALSIYTRESRAIYMPQVARRLCRCALSSGRLDIAAQLAVSAEVLARTGDFVPASDGLEIDSHVLTLLREGDENGALSGALVGPFSEIIRGVIDLLHGRTGVAFTHFDTGRRESSTMSSPFVVAECDLWLAACERLMGRTSDARRRAEDATGLFRSEGASRRLTEALTELSFIAAAEGHADEARRHAEEALELIREVGNRFDEPMALAALARSYEVAGEPAVAESYHARWRRLVAGMGALGLRKLIEANLGLPPGVDVHG